MNKSEKWQRLTQSGYDRLITRFGVVQCRRCEAPLKPGDRFKPIVSRQKTKRYCKDCGGGIRL